MAHWYRKLLLLRQIKNITDDWLTPVDYLPYIDALLDDIDLDPCSTHLANNQFLRAKKIYTLENDGLNIEEPWTGKTYLFPPTYGKCSYSEKRGTWKWSMKAHGRSIRQLLGLTVWKKSGNFEIYLKHSFLLQTLR